MIKAIEIKSAKDCHNHSHFRVCLALFNKRAQMDLQGKIASVIQYNVISDKDAPIIEKLDSNTIRMTLPCCGKWWWKHNAGALDYQNEYFKVEILGGWQQEVKITFINKPDDIVYLFQDGTVFKEWK